MIHRHLSAMLILLFSLALVACASSSKYPDQSDDGLKRIDNRSLDALYWREGASLEGYDKVMIGDVDVSFRKNWLRDQNIDRRDINNRVTPEDMEKIRSAVADGFTDVFIKELTSAGYAVVAVAGDDVLELEPAIVDLDLNAPDLSMRQPGMVSTYTTSAGQMTLNMAMYDSGTRSLIGRVIDERKDMDTGQLQFTNSITNKQAAIVMFRSWAKQLVRALDDSRSR